MLKLAWACNVLEARLRCRVLLVSGCCCLVRDTLSVHFTVVRRILVAKFCFPEDFIFTFFSACSSRSFHHPTCVIHLAYTHYHCMSCDKYGLISRTQYLPFITIFFCLRQVLASVLVRRQIVERAANDELKGLKSVHTFVIITTAIQKKCVDNN